MPSWANFRVRLPEHVRSLGKVAQRSTVALVKLPIGGPPSLAMCRLNCQPNLPLRKDLSICNLLQIWKKPLEWCPLYLPPPPRWVGLFKGGVVFTQEQDTRPFLSAPKLIFWKKVHWCVSCKSVAILSTVLTKKTFFFFHQKNWESGEKHHGLSCKHDSTLEKANASWWVCKFQTVSFQRFGNPRRRISNQRKAGMFDDGPTH
jgi:hypothetical protein